MICPECSGQMQNFKFLLMNHSVSEFLKIVLPQTILSGSMSSLTEDNSRLRSGT